MRSRSPLIGAVIALTATLIGALTAQALVGGAESTRAYSFMGKALASLHLVGSTRAS